MANFSRTTFLLAAILGTLILAITWLLRMEDPPVATTVVNSGGSGPLSSLSDSRTPPASYVSPWRLTTEGWQDSSKWPAIDPYVPRQTIEQIHPLVWSAMLFLAIIATVIWASSEWEIARIFDRRK